LLGASAIGAIPKAESPEIKVDESQLEGLELGGKFGPGIIGGIEKDISGLEQLKRVTDDPERIQKYNDQIAVLRQRLNELNGEQVKSNLEIIVELIVHWYLLKIR